MTNDPPSLNGNTSKCIVRVNEHALSQGSGHWSKPLVKMRPSLAARLLPDIRTAGLLHDERFYSIRKAARTLVIFALHCIPAGGAAETGPAGC